MARTGTPSDLCPVCTQALHDEPTLSTNDHWDLIVHARCLERWRILHADDDSSRVRA